MFGIGIFEMLFIGVALLVLVGVATAVGIALVGTSRGGRGSKP